MRKLLRSSKVLLKKNAPTILTVMGGVGVVATSVMAVKATPKALKLLEEARKEKGEELTGFEIVRTAGSSYIPAVVTGVGTLACIFGANVLGIKHQASIMSAYALVDRSYKDYKKKVDDVYGKEAGASIRGEIAKDKYEDQKITIEDDKMLFYDNFSERYFESTMAQVQQAEYRINRHLAMRDYAYVNEFYEELGIKPIDGGYELGWSSGGNEARYWQVWIDFTHEKVEMEDGLECHIIVMQGEPYLGFEDFS